MISSVLLLWTEGTVIVETKYIGVLGAKRVGSVTNECRKEWSEASCNSLQAVNYQSDIALLTDLGKHGFSIGSADLTYPVTVESYLRTWYTMREYITSRRGEPVDGKSPAERTWLGGAWLEAWTEEAKEISWTYSPHQRSKILGAFSMKCHGPGMHLTAVPKLPFHHQQRRPSR